jgi:hypothetical protein
VITNAKELSIEINKKQAIAEKTEARIDATRETYRPIAVHVAWLFFNISELCNIEPMYQYSLMWYVKRTLCTIEPMYQYPLMWYVAKLCFNFSELCNNEPVYQYSLMCYVASVC